MKQRLLIVDDEPGIVDMMASYFSSQYEVLTAYCGNEALQKLARQPDLILLDINMPDIDGLTLCQKIRELITCPILFLTARVESADKIIGFQAGADDYIIKPFDIRIIIVYAAYRHLSYPRFNVHFGQLVKKFQRCVKGAADILPVVLVICHLYVKHTKVGDLEKLRNVIVHYTARCVKAGVYPLPFAFLKKLGYEFCLHKRLSAGYRDTAVLAEIITASQHLFHNVFDGSCFTAACISCFGIVTVSATERTPLQEQYKPHSRTVKRAERLYCAVSALHVTSPCGTFC